MNNLERTCAAILAVSSLVATTTARADSRPLPSNEGPPEISSPRGPASRGPMIYISGYDHLAEVTKEDDLISGMARRLATRRTVAYSLELGALVPLTLATVLSYKSSDHTLFYGGITVSVAAAFAGALIMPRSRDLYQVVNAWNERHLDRPLSITAVSSAGSDPLF